MKSQEANVVKILLENKEADLNIKSISKILNKDYKNVHNIVNRLSKKKLVKLIPFGRSYRVILSQTAHPIIYEAEFTRREEILKNKNLKAMFESIMKLKSKFFVLLLFGSYAKKSQTMHSDIDLLFVVPRTKNNEILNIVNTLPLEIHVNIFTEDEFAKMNKSKETTIVSEAINNNIVLHGIETYYELIR